MVDVWNHRGVSHFHKAADNLPRIRSVGTDRPWVWLASAWQDMRASPMVSLAYGTLAVVSSFVLVAGLAMAELEYLILPMAAGFLLVGPLFAVGLYETSRRLERGERPTLERVTGAYSRNGVQIGGVGIGLLLALLAWIQLALLNFAIYFAAEPPGPEQFIDRLFFSADTIPFLITGTILGGLVAAAAFAISVVSIPMLIDRDTDAFTAMATSVAVVRENWRTMVVWGFLIALFSAAGMVTGFLGMALAFPLIGHASWHCYRDLVER